MGFFSAQFAWVFSYLGNAFSCGNFSGVPGRFNV